MLSVEDWAEIRRLHRSERLPIKAIARLMGVSRNTVRSALAADGPPKYQRAKSGSIVDVVEPRIRELLHEFPTMPATVIAERIGWDRSIRTLSTRVAELRPVYLPPDPASRTTYLPGEIAQCDFWFPPITLPIDHGHVRNRDETTGLDDDLRIFALVLCLVDSHPRRRRPVRRLVAPDRRARRSAPSTCLGRRRCHRPMAAPQGGTNAGLPGISRHSRCESARL